MVKLLLLLVVGLLLFCIGCGISENTADVSGVAPTTPSNPVPAVGATGVEPVSLLQWSSYDADVGLNGDSLTFSLYLGRDSLLVSQMDVRVLIDASLAAEKDGGIKQIDTLKSGVTYFWRVVAHDKGNVHVNDSSAVWYFTVKADKANADGWTIYSMGNSKIPGNIVLSLAVGADNKVWIGTSGAGLSIFDPGTTLFTNHDTSETGTAKLRDNSIYSMAFVNGTAYLGTNKGIGTTSDMGVTFDTTKADTVVGKEIRGISVDNSGMVWTGSFYKGVYKGVSRVWKNKSLNPSDTTKYLISKKVWALAIGTDVSKPLGGIWAATERGLAVYDSIVSPDTLWRTLTTSNTPSLPDTVITTVAIGASGTIWCGTYSYGLLKFENGTFTQTVRNDTFPSNRMYVTSLLIDHTGKIWVGTNQGLGRYNPTSNTWDATFLLNTENLSVPNATINALAEDVNGNIWVGTNGGGMAKCSLYAN